MLLYKYRSLNEWKYVLDILLHSRIYAASYLDLNDPMEGYYAFASDRLVSKEYNNHIRRAKSKWRICSLSEEPYSTLMWSYYAAGHAGIAVGMNRPRPRDDRRTEEVMYDNFITIDQTTRPADETAVEILSRKLDSWGHEFEHRVFSTEPFVRVTIKEVLLGCRVAKDDEKLLRCLLGQLRPKVKIRKLTESDLFEDYPRKPRQQRRAERRELEKKRLRAEQTG